MPKTYLPYPRLERGRSINFILVLRGGPFEGALRSRAGLKGKTSNELTAGCGFEFNRVLACSWACIITLLKLASQLFTTSPLPLLHPTIDPALTTDPPSPRSLLHLTTSPLTSLQPQILTWLNPTRALQELVGHKIEKRAL